MPHHGHIRAAFAVRLARMMVALLLGVGAPLAIAAPRARAQVPTTHINPIPDICTPPGCTVTYPPSVIVSPSSGSALQMIPQVITFTYCDSIQYVGGTQKVTWNGGDVTSLFSVTTGTSSPGCHYANKSTGTLTPLVGTNTISASVYADLSGNIWADTGRFTYTGYRTIVTPVTATWYDSAQALDTYTFTVTNVTTASTTYTLSVNCPTSLGCALPNGTTGTIAVAGNSVQVPVTFTAGAIGTSAAVALTASEPGVTATTGTVTEYAVLNPTRGLIVHVVTNPWWITPGLDSTVFSVTNKARAAEAVTVTPTCTGSAFTGTCTVPTTSFTIPGSSTSNVVVHYTGSSTLSTTGNVKLVAVPTNFPSGTDSAIADVEVRGPTAPGVVLQTQGEDFDNGNCLDISVAPGAAYQCGDLRVVHPLPAAYTYNKKRQPVLMYRAQAANPRPTYRAWVTLNPADGIPDSVTAEVLEGRNVVMASGSFFGSDFGTGLTRQIGLSFTEYNGAHQANGDELQVNAFYAARQLDTAYMVTGWYGIDRQQASLYGSGWTVAGVEFLVITPQTGGAPLLFWTGGDGSYRNYWSPNSPLYGTTFITANLARPDTIKAVRQPDGSLRYVRYAGHGVQVVFDSTTGRHIQTIDRLGHVTQFFYHTATTTDLDSITAPAPGSRHLTWAFHYDATTGMLDSLNGPQVGGGQSRTVHFTHQPTTGYLTSITDPDGHATSFAYSTGSGAVMSALTDRKGTVATFSYDGGQLLNTVVRDTGQSHLNLTLQFTPGETRGLGVTGSKASSVSTDSVYTLANGPLLGTNITKYWIDATGEPARIRDALGYETVLTRADSRWPVAITRIRYADGRVEGATYDARGNPATVTDSSMSFVVGGVTRYATDSASWDQTLDFPLRSVSAGGTVSWNEYDPMTGNRTGIMTYPDTTSGSAYWIRFGFDPVTHLTTSMTTSLTPAQNMAYDSLGNLATEQSPLGYWLVHAHDAIGRDTLSVSPIDSTDFTPYSSTNTHVHAFHRKYYDALDRVIATVDSANDMQLYEPCGGGTFLAHGLVAHTITVYNADGTPATVSRWSAPDPTNIDTATTLWRYDALGRAVAQVAPDLAVDSMVYDLAGNQVRHVTRNGYVLIASYDALDRPILRIVPPAATFDTTTGAFGHFPRYDNSSNDRGELTNNTNGTINAPADTLTFTYDAVSRVRHAFNRDAHISRTYNPNGTLATDSLAIRTYSGVDFTTHVYGVQYGYDLDNHQLWVKHPANLVGAPSYDSSASSYDQKTGLLHTATDVMGNTFTFTYDVIGRLTDISYSMAGSGATQLYENFGYDTDSRLIFHNDWTTAFADQSDTGWNSNWVRNDTVTHDGRGKVMNVWTHTGQYAHGEVVRNRYDGMGLLAVYQRNVLNADGSEDSEGEIQHLEYLGPDAFGNEGSTNQCIANGADLTSTFQAHTGRMTSQRWADNGNGAGSVAHETTTFDAAGNVRFVDRDGGFERGSTNGVDQTESVNFYTADDQLKYSDRRSNYGVYADSSYPYPSIMYRTYMDEFRYDALGRRVLRRSRADSLCLVNNCYSVIDRYVYDGDQPLYEIQSPGYDTSTTIEHDTTQLQTDSRYFGRVVYLNGPTVDRPLDVIRYGFAAQYGSTFKIWGPQAVIPHYNWQDQPDFLSFQNGVQQKCVAGGTSQCVMYQLPASTNVWLKNATYNATSWLGSALAGQTEQQGSGLQYKRNRFYDPVTNRFTQEDPTGLGGGLNAYGFADGDPASYRDPYGTCPVCVAIIVGALIGAAGAAVDVAIHGGHLTLGVVGLGALSGAIGGVISWGVGELVPQAQQALLGASPDAATPTAAATISDADLTTTSVFKTASSGPGDAYNITYLGLGKTDPAHTFPTFWDRIVINTGWVSAGKGTYQGIKQVMYQEYGHAKINGSASFGKFQIGGYWVSANEFVVTHRLYVPIIRLPW